MFLQMTPINSLVHHTRFELFPWSAVGVLSRMNIFVPVSPEVTQDFGTLKTDIMCFSLSHQCMHL